MTSYEFMQSLQLQYDGPIPASEMARYHQMRDREREAAAEQARETAAGVIRRAAKLGDGK